MASPKLPLLASAACAVIGLAASAAMGCGDDAPTGAPVDGGLDGARPVVDSAAEASVVLKGARVLGIAMPIGDLAFGQNVQTASDGGARATNVTLAWDEVERPYDSGAPDAAEDAAAPTQLFNPSLHVADLVLSEYKTQALIAVTALDVGGSRAPAELATRPLDDAELGARYDKVTDYVLRGAPDLVVAALFVGTEVDVPLGDDPAKHAAFAAFVGRAAAHAHAVRPGLKVGFTVTADGIEARGPRLAAAWAASDVIGLTYLPVDAAARARSPLEVAADLDRIVAAAPPGKPIFVREAGFPTAAACGGDEATQAAFVSALFGAWDRHAARIPLVILRELGDAPPEAVTALAARHGRSDAPFLAFLGSLGLRSADGRTKQGWEALIREARLRGF